MPQDVSNPVVVSGMAVNGMVVDTFTTASGPTVDFFPAGTPVDEVHAASEALGGQRDFNVELLSGNVFDKVELEANSGVLSVNPDFGAIGRYTRLGMDSTITVQVLMQRDLAELILLRLTVSQVSDLVFV